MTRIGFDRARTAWIADRNNTRDLDADLVLRLGMAIFAPFPSKPDFATVAA